MTHEKTFSDALALLLQHILALLTSPVALIGALFISDSEFMEELQG